jgi:hypothetical protein
MTTLKIKQNACKAKNDYYIVCIVTPTNQNKQGWDGQMLLTSSKS